MRHAGILAAMALIGILASVAPAHAEFGAFAYDSATGKYGFSWNERDQGAADAAALKGCASGNCKIVFHTGPKECGAIAISNNPKESNAWGGAVRENKTDAEARSIADCKKHTEGQCKVRGSVCNR